MVIPVTEVATLLLAEGRERLPLCCALPLAPTQSIRIANDKAQVLAIADALGVPTPRTVVVQRFADMPRADEFDYPVVFKPSRSRVRILDGWLSTGVGYAESHEELERRLRALPPEVFPVLVQERIVGPGVGVFAAFGDLGPVAWFSHRRLREKPPSGGISVLCESIPLDESAVEYSSRLLSRLAWRGVAMVEFKRDDRDGSLRLMEINGRFWGSLQLAIDSGVNFPELLLATTAGRATTPVIKYRTGVRSRWLAGDLDALLMLLTRSRQTLHLAPSHVGRLRASWDFFHIWGRDLHYEIERRDDPGPGLLEWRRRLLGR